MARRDPRTVVRGTRRATSPEALAKIAAVKLDPEWEHMREWISVNSHGYACISFEDEHRLLSRYILDAPRGKVVDHKNGDKLDNRLDNLRLLSIKDNVRNSPPKRAFVGVYPIGRRWRAMISGKHLGLFATPEEAQRARLVAEKELWGIHPQREALFAQYGLL